MHIQKASVGLPGQLRSRHSAPATPAASEGEGGGHHHHHGITATVMHVGHDAAMIAMSLPGGHHHHQVTPPALPDMGDICSSTPAPAAHDHSAHAAHAEHGAHAGHDAHAGHGAQAGHGGHEGHGGHGGHEGHNPAPPAGGGHDHHAGGNNWLHHGSAAVSGLVAATAVIHGAQMLGSKDNFTRLEGANHLLMGASSGVMAASMWAPSAGLGGLSTGLMAAHGLGEVALGAYQFARGVKDDCDHDKLGGLLKTVHGGCLAAAQAFPGVALPLYLGMGAATMAQLSLQQSGLVH